MLKIVEIHLSKSVTGEYVVLQNQGLTTVGLRGWALTSDAYLNGDMDLAGPQTCIFTDDVQIKPYTRVVLFTGCGEGGWHPTIDGKFAYLFYWCRRECIWSHVQHVHLLHLAASRKVVQPEDAGLMARI